MIFFQNDDLKNQWKTTSNTKKNEDDLKKNEKNEDDLTKIKNEDDIKKK